MSEASILLLTLCRDVEISLEILRVSIKASSSTGEKLEVSVLCSGEKPSMTVGGPLRREDYLQ